MNKQSVDGKLCTGNRLGFHPREASSIARSTVRYSCSACGFRVYGSLISRLESSKKEEQNDAGVGCRVQGAEYRAVLLKCLLWGVVFEAHTLLYHSA